MCKILRAEVGLIQQEVKALLQDSSVEVTIFVNLNMLSNEEFQEKDGISFDKCYKI